MTECEKYLGLMLLSHIFLFVVIMCWVELGTSVIHI